MSGMAAPDYMSNFQSGDLVRGKSIADGAWTTGKLLNFYQGDKTGLWFARIQSFPDPVRHVWADTLEKIEDPRVIYKEGDRVEFQSYLSEKWIPTTVEKTFSKGDQYVKVRNPMTQHIISVNPERVRLSPNVESTSTREGVLDEAKSLITGERNASYGAPTQNFQDTADMWNVQFSHLLKDGEKFGPSEIAQAMILLKMVRMKARKKRDNWVDIAGYAGCGAECDDA